MEICCIIVYNFQLYLQVPFPEDVVRCHAVMQALAMDLCHCVYANKTYTIGKNSVKQFYIHRESLHFEYILEYSINWSSHFFLLEKDDVQWAKDLAEARKFLDSKGFH